MPEYVGPEAEEVEEAVTVADEDEDEDEDVLPALFEYVSLLSLPLFLLPL